jgi:hypothetical protein
VYLQQIHRCGCCTETSGCFAANVASASCSALLVLCEPTSPYQSWQRALHGKTCTLRSLTSRRRCLKQAP